MKIINSLLLCLVFMSCKVEPKKIDYGNDACHYCKMTIVETKHAAEIVTKKGRAYKYDAIECMINELKTRDVNKIELFLVTDYTMPEKLIKVEDAVFLISKQIKSPMGAFLSAFSKKEDAQKYEGTFYNWTKIQEKFQKKNKGSSL